MNAWTATWVSVGVVAQALLDEARERREHQARVDTLLVEQVEARLRLTERGDAAHWLAGEFAQRLTVGVVRRVEGHVRARPGNDLERRVRDELGEDVADHQLLAALELDEAEQVPVARRQVPGERVFCLIEMVVRVEHREIQAAHHGARCSTDAPAAESVAVMCLPVTLSLNNDGAHGPADQRPELRHARRHPRHRARGGAGTGRRRCVGSARRARRLAAREAAATLGPAGAARAIGLAADLTRPGDAEAVLAAATQELGTLRGVAVTTGLGMHGQRDLLSATDDDWEDTFADVVLATVRACRAAVPLLVDGGGGAIVTTAAYSVRAPKPHQAPYASCKAAVATLTKTIAKSYGPQGVRANCVCPGATETDILAAMRVAVAA